MYNGSWDGNFAQTIVNLGSDGTGTANYAWAAGRGAGGAPDSAPTEETRVFNIRVYDDGGTTKADGFFGYGPTVGEDGSDDGSVADGYEEDYGIGSIDVFICNWAGPGSQHSQPDFANYGQWQTMTKNSTTGVFEATASYIDYSPVNACQTDDTDFIYEYPTGGTAPVSAHTLQDLSSNDSYTAYVAAKPAAPTIPFNAAVPLP